MVTTLGDFTTLGRPEKIFMMVTMCVFLMIGGYALSTLTGILSSDAVMTLRENKTMERKLDRVADHVIVIGFAALGRLVAGRLRDAGEHVIVVDRAGDLAAQASDLGYLVVQGDAGLDDAVLDHSGVQRAKALVVTTEDPDRKLSITLLAHSINPKLKIAVTGTSTSGAGLLHRGRIGGGDHGRSDRRGAGRSARQRGKSLMEGEELSSNPPRPVFNDLRTTQIVVDLAWRILAHRSGLLRNDRRAGAQSERRCSRWTLSKDSNQRSSRRAPQTEPFQDRIADCASLTNAALSLIPVVPSQGSEGQSSARLGS